MRPATVVGGPENAGRATVPANELPEDIGAGDLLAVAGTGAYHHRADPFVGRPPVLGVGLVRTLVRRETVAGRGEQHHRVDTPIYAPAGALRQAR
jgi:diaminopimelate decarboxylase